MASRAAAAKAAPSKCASFSLMWTQVAPLLFALVCSRLVSDSMVPQRAIGYDLNFMRFFMLLPPLFLNIQGVPRHDVAPFVSLIRKPCEQRRAVLGRNHCSGPLQPCRVEVLALGRNCTTTGHAKVYGVFLPLFASVFNHLPYPNNSRMWRTVSRSTVSPSNGMSLRLATNSQVVCSAAFDTPRS